MKFIIVSGVFFFFHLACLRACVRAPLCVRVCGSKCVFQVLQDELCSLVILPAGVGQVEGMGKAREGRKEGEARGGE